MEPRIETIAHRKLVGRKITMSYAENKTAVLWRSFMPQRKEIANAVSADLFSLQVFGDAFDFRDMNAVFEKWAAVEVSDFDSVPGDMESFDLSGGLYAVFQHKGAAQTAPKTFGYIFGVWLPASGYELDDRPHFEVLGEKYRNDHPDSEEEIWIPIRKAVL